VFDVFIQAAFKVQYLRRAGFNDEVFAVHAVNDDTPVSREVEELGFDVTCFHRGPMMEWLSMDSAPKDGRKILVRRFDDVRYEYAIVRWDDDGGPYPWVGEWNAYPDGRLDEWCMTVDLPTVSDNRDQCKRSRNEDDR
jgi:hypothetical protein